MHRGQSDSLNEKWKMGNGKLNTLKIFNFQLSIFDTKAAFTLAEVLITLAIIGVVAAMTIPTLINNYKEKQYITSLKKTVSVINNAYKLAIFENGDSNEFGYLEPKYNYEGVTYDENGKINGQTLANTLSKYLKIAKDCGMDNGEECFPETVYNWNSDEQWNLPTMQGRSRHGVVLNDGTSLLLYPRVHSKITVYIDTNGLKKPNKVGIDVFQAEFDTKGNYLPMDNKENGSVRCYTSNFACSDWIISNGNMDYLHCNDLNWKTKTKCK